MDVVEVLVAARAEIDTPDKWYQGDFCEGGVEHLFDTPKPPCCGYGAICRVVNAFSNSEQGANKFLANAVGGEFPSDYAKWQDQPERTHDEVITAFDRAIELAKEEQHES